ncbi:MAG TPA: hypothetical protein VJP58_06355 [Candidatus Nitrosocosmicus sp.]|nr:hypothetical protein [Candidatus Nitrosocosmicus sp.]
MGSNPTPRAYLGDLYNNFISHRKANNDRTTNLAHLRCLSYNEKCDKESQVFKRIDSLTRSCTKQYFNSILTKLARENIENANTICDYIMAEETEINIKNSTKEGVTKVLVWLSNYHNNKKPV